MSMHQPKERLASSTPEKRRSSRKRGTSRVTEVRAITQRAKLDAQARMRLVRETPASRPPTGALTAVATAIEEHRHPTEGGNRPAKTSECRPDAFALVRCSPASE